MKKHKRLKKTLSAVQHCVDKAEYTYQMSMKLCHEKQQSIESLNDYQVQYRQILQQKSTEGIKAWQLQQFDQFNHYLVYATLQEQQNLTQLQRQANNNQTILNQQQTKKFAIENLTEQSSKQLQQKEENEEQTQTDDLISHYREG